MPTLENLLEGRFKSGNTTYKLDEIKSGATGEIIWPLNLTYELVVSSLAVVYSSGTQINARATNYAYVTGEIITKRGTTVIDDSVKVLTPVTWNNSNYFALKVVEGVTTNYLTGVDHDPVNYPGYGMGVDPDYPNGIDCKVSKLSYNGTEFEIASASRPTIHQQGNTATATGTTDITTAFEYALSTNQFNHSGGTVTVSGTQTYSVQTSYLWTSQATSTAITSTGNTRSHLPDTLLITPTPKSIAQDLSSFVLDVNSTSSKITYQTIASLDGKAGTPKNVEVLAAVYEYRNLQISQYGYNDLPAKGGSAYPTYLLLQMEYSIDGVWQTGYLSGYPANGATTATLSATGHSTTVNVAYKRKSGSSWVTDTDKGLVTATTRGYNEDTQHTTATVSYPNRRVTVSKGSLSDTKDVTVYQAANAKHRKSHTYDHYVFSLSSSTATSAQTTISFSGLAYFNDVYYWDSEAPDTTGTSYESQYPTTVTQQSPASPSATINTTTHQITIPANSGSTGREFTFRGTYNNKYDDDSITQSGEQYTYETPSVDLDYEVIGAAALTGYPTIYIEQVVKLNGTKVATLKGSLTGGATSGTARDTSAGMEANFSIYSTTGSVVSGNGGSFNSNNAAVSTSTRGTTTGAERDVVTGITVTLEINGKRGTSGTKKARQAANAYERTEPASYSSCRISAVSPSGNLPCTETTVTATVKASGVDAKDIYTSYDDGDHATGYTGGGSFTDREVTADVLYYRKGSSGSYSSVSNSNSFTADNRFNTSSVTWYIYAKKGTAESSTTTKTQNADAKSDWKYDSYDVSTSVGSGISAAGGTATITATGSRRKYKTWTDGTVVDASTVPFEPTITLESNPGTSIFWKSNDESYNSSTGVKTVTLNHRDMTNNVTTDSVTVRGSVTGKNSDVSVSAMNVLTETTVNGSWGAPYPITHDYSIKDFTISAYTTAASPAPFSGGETTYTATAHHYVTNYHDRPVYKIYSSWTEEYNDDNHREFYRTDSEATGAATEVTGDPVTMYTSLAWVTIDTTNSKLIFTAQSSGSQPRSGYVSAKNADGGSYTNINVFQAGYAEISRSPAFLVFNAAGGEKTFTVTYAYTTFDITYPRPKVGQNPILNIVPSNGGSASGTGSLVVTVECGPKDVSDLLDGIITIHPTAAGLSDLTIRVTQ